MCFAKPISHGNAVASSRSGYDNIARAAPMILFGPAVIWVFWPGATMKT